MIKIVGMGQEQTEEGCHNKQDAKLGEISRQSDSTSKGIHNLTVSGEIWFSPSPEQGSYPARSS